MAKRTANAKEEKVKLEELTPNRAERRRAAHAGVDLTDAEKVTFGILFERSNTLQQQVQQCQMALSANIRQAVELRGLDPQKFGVNLGVGKILPVDKPALLPKGNGVDPG